MALLLVAREDRKVFGVNSQKSGPQFDKDQHVPRTFWVLRAGLWFGGPSLAQFEITEPQKGLLSW